MNDSAVNDTPDKEIVHYYNLSESQQEVIKEALERDCNIQQNVFRFQGEHPEVIKYDGEYYALYVGVRTVTTTT